MTLKEKLYKVLCTCEMSNLLNPKEKETLLETHDIIAKNRKEVLEKLAEIKGNEITGDYKIEAIEEYDLVFAGMAV